MSESPVCELAGSGRRGRNGSQAALTSTEKKELAELCKCARRLEGENEVLK
ncbi:MAG: hypothetical protein LC799_29825 [Actinobacteria bacterium]|nr:hypothetical protein [Actinomycetota bacterium]